MAKTLTPFFEGFVAAGKQVKRMKVPYAYHSVEGQEWLRGFTMRTQGPAKRKKGSEACPK